MARRVLERCYMARLGPERQVRCDEAERGKARQVRTGELPFGAIWRGVAPLGLAGIF